MNKLIIEDDGIIGGRLIVETKFHNTFGKWVDLRFDYEGQQGAEEFRITPSLKKITELRNFLNTVILDAESTEKVRLMKDPITELMYLAKGRRYLHYWGEDSVSVADLHPLVESSLDVVIEDCQYQSAKNFDNYGNPDYIEV